LSIEITIFEVNGPASSRSARCVATAVNEIAANQLQSCGNVDVDCTPIDIVGNGGTAIDISHAICVCGSLTSGIGLASAATTGRESHWNREPSNENEHFRKMRSDSHKNGNGGNAQETSEGFPFFVARFKMMVYLKNLVKNSGQMSPLEDRRTAAKDVIGGSRKVGREPRKNRLLPTLCEAVEENLIDH
jgi:hypothetical protein